MISKMGQKWVKNDPFLRAFFQFFRAKCMKTVIFKSQNSFFQKSSRLYIKIWPVFRKLKKRGPFNSGCFSKGSFLDPLFLPRNRRDCTSKFGQNPDHFFDRKTRQLLTFLFLGWCFCTKFWDTYSCERGEIGSKMGQKRGPKMTQKSLFFHICSLISF